MVELFGHDIEKDLPLIGISVWNIIVAIIILIVGIILAKIIGNIVKKSLLKAKVNVILSEFMARLLRIIIVIFVIFTALGSLGLGDHMAVIIGSVALVLGLVLGFAFSDTLGNIASGIMIAITKPFKKEDFVEISGKTGIIKSVGISVTELDTLDNKRIIIPNKSVFGNIIVNYTRHPIRRVDMMVGVGYGEDLNKVLKTTMDVLTSHNKILKNPAPQVAVNEMAESSMKLVVRPWCKTEDYWDVFFDLQKAIKESYNMEGIKIPFPQMEVHLQK